MPKPRPRISAFPKCYLDAIESGELDLYEWIERSRSLDAEGLELYWPWFFRSRDDASLRDVRRTIESSGRSVSLLCVSPDFTQPDPAAREQELESYLRAIDAAAILGASCCRALSGQKHPGVTREEGVAWVVEALRRAVEHAAARGVTLALENHYRDGHWRFSEFAQKSDVYLEILDAIQHERFGAQYDPSNAIVAGDDPIALLERVAPRVVSVHASDRWLEPGFTLDDLREADGTLGYPRALHHGVTGEGLVDWDRTFTILRESGFSGWISIEDGMNGMEEMARSLEFLHRGVAEHWGA